MNPSPIRSSLPRSLGCIGILRVISCVLLPLMACGRDQPAEAMSRAETSQAAAAREPESFTWPTDSTGGAVLQIGKHAADLDDDQMLWPMSRLPGGFMPEHDIAALGVECWTTQEVEEALRSQGWVVVDVRKDAEVDALGMIPGSVHHEYRHEGFHYAGRTRLTAEVCRTLLEQSQGLIFACNGPNCPRSFNACLAAVQLWGIPAGRVRWYRAGVPGWTASPLVPSHAVAREQG